ncbi:ABC-type Mn2+/Zn2+ transport system, permease components [Hahella chejuensis KCTC 2396]|uniref:ABC-type Mn2+/Zn2+ transport system, permease components n=2 Tax=Hahella chejuensis TaxID=158327 RepID=Q2SI06_HAHCH|nr:ABC-type Mn2+/Zn2+ transport system, permease components [Hahella chejuensis KCTC 2396]
MWIWTPVCASVLLSLMLAPLGDKVLQRGVVFADIAIAQWAALGVLAGGRFAWSREWGGSLAGFSFSGLVFALLASGIVHLILQRGAAYREAMIGVLYVVGASLATISVSHDPHGAQALAATLNGDLLWSLPSQLYVLAPVALLIVGWLGFSSEWRQQLFLPLFALAVTVSVEVAGVYVVFATLITTPLLLCRIGGRGIVSAIVICIAGHIAGLIVAAWGDFPVGASVVLCNLVVGVVALLLLRRLQSKG